ncbi:MAG: hypothetical protein ABW221_12895 [Vicinamibacteria bacterium]
MAAFPSIQTGGHAGRARWATVRVETDDGVYIGRMFIPEMKKRLSDVLCDERPFILLTEPTKDAAPMRESFVAVNKTFVRTVRVLAEHEAEGLSLKGRR